MSSTLPRPPPRPLPPPSILVPAAPHSSSTDNTTLSGPSRHFISPAQFSAWQASNPKDRLKLRPGASTTTTYEAPKHPSASLLQNIPQRRTTSRCNIVEWVLWKAANELRDGGRNAVVAKRAAEERGRRPLLSAGEHPPATGDTDHDVRMAVAEDDDEVLESYLALQHQSSKAAGLNRIAHAMMFGAQPCPMSVAEQLTKGVKVGSSVSVRAPVVGAERWSDTVEKRRRFTVVVGGLVEIGVKGFEDGLGKLSLGSPISSGSATPRAAPTTLNTTPRMATTEMPLTPSESVNPPSTNTPTLPEPLQNIEYLSRRSESAGPKPSKLSINRSDSSRNLLKQKLAAEEKAELARSEGQVGTTGMGMGMPAMAVGVSSLTPHDDYRILHSDKMRKRAQQIYSVGLPSAVFHSPSTSTSTSTSTASASATSVAVWCPTHLVRSCPTCAQLHTITDNLASSRTPSKSKQPRTPRPAHPGDGLCEPSSYHMSTGLAGVLPDFLVLCANVLKEFDRERRGIEDLGSGVGGLGVLEEKWEREVLAMEDKTVPVQDVDQLRSTTTVPPTSSSSTPNAPVALQYHPRQAWYGVLKGLLVRALLGGYLVEGWKGVEPVEVLCGIGIGGYDNAGARMAWSGSGGKGGKGEEGSSGRGVGLRVGEEEKRKTVMEAAMLLFGTRNTEQGDYERTMRDVAHEFLDVNEGVELSEHLEKLNIKYPLSDFEEQALDLLEVIDFSMGKPELAKDEERAAQGDYSPSIGSNSGSTIAAASTGLARYFGQTNLDEGPLSGMSMGSMRQPKRRRGSLLGGPEAKKRTL